MPIVTVKKKYQVVIPQNVRRQVRINVGDLLEATVQRGRIMLTPKSLVDREIAEGLEDLKRGRTHGPFDTADDAVAFLHAAAKKTVRREAARRQ